MSERLLVFLVFALIAAALLFLPLLLAARTPAPVRRARATDEAWQAHRDWLAAIAADRRPAALVRTRRALEGLAALLARPDAASVVDVEAARRALKAFAEALVASGGRGARALDAAARARLPELVAALDAARANATRGR